MSKTIVTHLSPDLDAITSSWLIKRYLPGWQETNIVFVPAGLTLSGVSKDTKDVIHVDTGLGRFDHHQTQEYTSSTKLVFEYLLQKKYLSKKVVTPLKRLVEFVNDTDHFAEAYFEEATADRYDFTLHQIVKGLKHTLVDDLKIMIATFPLLDAILVIMKNKVNAEEEIKKGLVFKSHWGKSIAMETNNEETMKLALKMGFSLVIRKDPENGGARIKTLPGKKLDLTPLYQAITKIDKKGLWFLHVCKNMLLNSSTKNPRFIPTPLTIPTLVAITKEI